MVGLVTNPHFKIPFTFGPGGVPVVEQDSITEIQQCAETGIRTERGTRDAIPSFGISDQAMLMNGANLSQIEDQVGEHEDRIRTHAEREKIITNAVDNVRVELTQKDPTNG